MPFKPLSAKNAKVRIGGTVFTAKKWTVTPKKDELDTTNFEGGGFAEQAFGIESCEVAIEADWDGNANPYDSPPSVKPGTELATVKLYINDVTGPFWSFPKLNVFEVPNTADVKATVAISVKAKGHGTFSYPTGAA